MTEMDKSATLSETGQGLQDIVTELGAFIKSKSATFACGGNIPFVRSVLLQCASEVY
jgi:hypothetical protein